MTVSDPQYVKMGYDGAFSPHQPHASSAKEYNGRTFGLLIDYKPSNFVPAYQSILFGSNTVDSSEVCKHSLSSITLA
jgi:hypothetical protein